MIFSDLARATLDRQRGDLARATLKTYRAILTKFDRFAPAVECEAMTPDLIRRFREYMQGIGNNANTISKTLAALRVIVNKVKDAAGIQFDPFHKVKIGGVRSNRQFLTLDELAELHTAFMARYGELSRAQFDAMQAFLFSCYTGLRYSDLKSLTSDEIKEGAIRKRMHKTGDSVYVPLTAPARELLALADRGGKRVLRVTENTYFNRHLRAAVAKLGFEKYIHCHLARHTFATSCLSLGIPLEVTSKLLGHRDIATTMIYARVVNKVLDAEMAKFDTIGRTS